MITDTRRPDALPVSFAAVLQPKLTAHVKTVEAIAHEFPVHQIPGMQDDQPRRAVHRRTRQIEIVSHADHVRIRKLVVEKRIGKRPVPVVGRPRLCLQTG